MATSSDAAATNRRGQRTVSGKLTLLVLTSVGLAVGLVASVSAWRDAERDATMQSERFRTTAAVMASLSAKAAADQNAADAFHILRSISFTPGVTYARIERRDGRLLAEVGSGGRLTSDVVLAADGKHDLNLVDQIVSRTTQVTSPILLDGAPVGRLVLLGRTPGVLAEILESLTTSALAAAMAVVLGLLIARRMQRSITLPISALATSMAAVREDHDYDRVLQVETSDEVAQLIDGFNAMLAEIRRRDRRIAEQVAGLEGEVASRTSDYRAAKESAEEANAAKSDFLATMSHEIRTPLNGIMVMAEMLAVGEMPPRQRRFADVIVNSGASLLAIINDILDFSKIEAGKMDVESIPVDVCDIVEDVCSLFWERAASKGIDLACFVDPALPRKIAADPVRLRQVIGNLVNNAIKFTDRGGVLVEVRPAGEAALRIYVRDTGVGIPADKIGSVFGAFNQADQTTTRRFGGTGLGLSISKRLVDAMGGRFSVSSTVGRGSTFAFELPAQVLEAAEPWPDVSQATLQAAVDVASQSTRHALSDYLKAARCRTAPQARGGAAVVRFTDGQDVLSGPSDVVSTVRLVSLGDTRPVLDGDPSARQAVLMRPPRRKDLMAILLQMQKGEAPSDPVGQEVSAAAAAAELPAFPGLRVLVADDSAVNREVALAALGRLGIVPELANDGVAAVAAATRALKPFDLILMDGSMPELDGYDASRAIRAFETDRGAPPTPIIALTAHVVGSAADAWRDAGMDDVLHKPFTLQSLANMLVKHLHATPHAVEEQAAAPSAVGMVDQGELIDQEIYAQIIELAAGGGMDFARKIQGLYRDNAPQCIVDLRQTSSMADGQGAAAAAHALKSMSFNIGAKRVSALAETVEHDAREGRLPSAACLGDIEAALAQTVDYFSRLA